MQAQNRDKKVAYKSMRALLIEDDPIAVGLTQKILAEVQAAGVDLESCDRLATGLERLGAGGVAVVLLDLSLVDSQGLDTFAKVHAHAPDVPIVVLTGSDDEQLAVQAVEQGAQDHLTKDQMGSDLLVRALRYAIERHRLQAEIRNLALTDELTGLHNQRGFLALAEQQLKLAQRMKTRQLLLVVGLNDPKGINGISGRQQGNQALFDVANILRRTCRRSDIIARLGADEYAVLAMDGHDGTDAITTRLQANIKVFHEKMDRRYTLALSVGVAIYDPQRPRSIDDLLAEAGESMAPLGIRDQGSAADPGH